jgi:dTDP-4-amino-4,6-dideoxygalactose transaminase
LERELREYLAADQVFLLSSGKAALTILLEAMSTLRRARKVAIPAYTCFSVPSAVVRAGLELILVDVDPTTLDFDEASLRRVARHHDLLCVVPTHLFGIAVDVAQARSICGSDLFILEDVAQAMGVPNAAGRPLGTEGDAAVFSFGRGKHLTCGSGGMIAVRSATLGRACSERCSRLPRATAIHALRSWIELAVVSALQHPRLFWLPAGLPFLGLGQSLYSTRFEVSTMSAVGVGALQRWKGRLEVANRHRAMTVKAIGPGIGSRAQSGPLLRLPVLLPTTEHRTSLLSAGGRRGLGISPMYPTAVHQIPALRARFAGQRFPGAEALATRLVTLPTHQFVRLVDCERLRAAHLDAVGYVQSTTAASPVPTC